MAEYHLCPLRGAQTPFQLHPVCKHQEQECNKGTNRIQGPFFLMMVLGQKPKPNKNTRDTFEKHSFSSPACGNTNSLSLGKGQVMCIFNKEPRKF